MRNRHAVSGAQAAEIPPLHAAGPTLTGRDSGHVDELADEKMISGNFRADRNETVIIDAEFGNLALRLNLGDCEITAIGTIGALHLALPRAKLQRDVTILVFGAVT
jgi:hypothetical protein